jgi:hypothetical protein
MKQTKCVIEPLLTPSFPAISLTLSGTHHVPSDLLLYPVFDHSEAATRIAYPKVVHPATKDRIDRFDQAPYGPAGMTTEDLPELIKQRCPLLQLGR